MQKKRVSTLAAALLLAATAVPSAHAFDVGGSNGWKFSTDGFLNVFATYESVQGKPAGVIDGELGLGSQGQTATTAGQHERQFRVRTGLLPVGIGFNVNAPTTNGVDYAIRLGIYPQVQNNGPARTDLSPNIDFREINMTATGAFGQVLAGRAINLYQAKNILTDMTLFSVGVVGPVNSGPTMGHIGYGYLYPNFDAQIRYTTPDMAGLKFAIAVGDPHSVGAATIQDVPRVEAELSYATTIPGGKVQAWVSGLYNEAKYGAVGSLPATVAAAGKAGKHARSVGGAGGVEVGMGPLDLLASTYGGKGLGMLGISGADATDSAGKERENFGYLAQATFMVTPVVKLGANYGQSRAYKTSADSDLNIMKQQSATATVTYNVAKFVQLIAEYTWAQDRWFGGQTQNANIGALGTFIYW